MKNLVVKNFGPITECELNVLPLTVFCGKQGSGKSTLAKLISTFTWMEKTLYRGYVKESEFTRKGAFAKKHCGYHYLTSYFKADSYLHYSGNEYTFTYRKGALNISKTKWVSNRKEYQIPKIMYIPAERNLLTVIEEAKNIRKLPASLRDMQVEYRSALKSNTIDKHLPINGFSVEYMKLNDTTWITGQNHKVRMHEAASGLQSAAPLVLTTRYLAAKVGDLSSELSADEIQRRNEELDSIMNSDLSGSTKVEALRALDRKYTVDTFVNIVEEPEQNLHPSAQKDILAILLMSLSQTEGNELIITTHSPYIINDISIAAKFNQVEQIINNGDDLLELNKLVPTGLNVPSKDIAIYEINDEGMVQELPLYNGIPSDENVLNSYLQESNDIFAQMMEIEDNARG